MTSSKCREPSAASAAGRCQSATSGSRSCAAMLGSYRALSDHIERTSSCVQMPAVASCPGHPEWGKCWPNSEYALPFGAPSLSNTVHVVPVVPWSIARIIAVSSGAACRRVSCQPLARWDRVARRIATKGDPMATGAVDQARFGGTDEAELRQLNDEYIRSFLESDVDWYREHLTDDYRGMLTNGSVIGKEEFLSETEAGPGMREFSSEDVLIRRYGDAAFVHARTPYLTDAGARGSTAYTDVWVRRPEGWRCVAAQLTRIEEN